MPLAPSLEELTNKKQASLQASQSSENIQGDTMSQDSVVPTKSIQSDLALGFTKVGIIGAGGAGKVAAIRASKFLSSTGTKITTIDTSGVETRIENVESIKIGDLNGSGKLRSENVEIISNFINDWITKTTFEDVTIILHALAGGSGSIITPLLIDEITRQGKIAIMIGIVDTESEIDTTNVFNSLRTYDNIVNKRKCYLPTVLFDNKFGRPTVDKGIDTVVKNLVDILIIPFVGLDTQDRVKFLNPHIFPDVEHGIKLISITNDLDKDWDDKLGMIIPETSYTKVDAVLLISKKDNHRSIETLCSVSFRGYYENDGSDYIVSIGYHIPQDFVKALNNRIHSFKSVTEVKKTSFASEYEIGQESKKGLVL